VVEPLDMQRAVDRLADTLSLSVLIEDIDQRPVWWSTRGAVDGTRLKTIVDRRVEPLAASVVQRLRLTQATEPVRVPAMPEAEMWARWCVTVRHEGYALGFVWVLDPDGRLGTPEMALVQDCAELAAEAIVQTRLGAERHRRERDELLDRLLTGPDQEAARELIRLERLAPDTRVQVHTAAAAGGWPLPGGLSVHIVGNRVRPAVGGAPLPMTELGEAARRARATRRAVAAGARLDTVSWDALGAWRLVVDAPAGLTPGEIHPGVDVLAAQPRDDLLTTARAVLDHGGEVAAAAAELHLHRTTLYYRLNRITTLTGVDLRSGTTRTNLQLALWLAAYRSTAEG